MYNRQLFSESHREHITFLNENFEQIKSLYFLIRVQRFNSVKFLRMDDIVEKIRARVASVDPNGPRTATGVYQLNIKSDDGSTRPVTLDLNKLEVLDGNTHDAPDVAVDFDSNTLLQVATNEISFEDAVQSGKATVAGNADLAKNLANVVSDKPIE